ncbi:MAG TPA: dipeptidase PepE [Leeuwenhoekiella sp.]|nr:dipeptidase PepE [Leeuwenhoekiella sp.]
MRKIILASTSTLYGEDYLKYLLPAINKHFEQVEKLLFIPYARPGGLSHELYTERVQEVFNELDIEVNGLHEFKDPLAAVKNAQGIFTGGGNTFLLVNELYRQKLIPALRTVLFNGTPYLGTSAGSNICGITMQTTNDMPIVYPPSFKTIGAVPFNINAHYLDPDAGDTHMGESRETRIKEYHKFNSPPVVGLREGSWLTVADDTIRVHGAHDARIFTQNAKPYEIPSGEQIVFS